MPEPTDYREISRLRVNELPYVFIIGFNKTGTRSLHNFFFRNGFPSVHYDGGRLGLTMLQNLVNGKKIFDGYDQGIKVFSDLIFINHSVDMQFNRFFRVMDRDYPNSYFIHNTRDTENWIRSRTRHSAHRGAGSFLSMSLDAHNTTDIEEVKAIWRREKERFEADVRQYFDGCDRYLELDIEKDDVCGLISKLLRIKLNCLHWQQIGKTDLSDISADGTG